MVHMPDVSTASVPSTVGAQLRYPDFEPKVGQNRPYLLPSP